MRKVPAPRPAARLLLPLALAACAACSRTSRELVLMVEEDQLSAWPVLQELANEFETRHPDVDVRLLPLGGAAARDRVRFLLAGDLQLDLVRIDIMELAGFVAEDALLDLEPFLAADPGWDPTAYWPQALDAIRGPDGHLVGLPSTLTPYVMYANLDLLAAAGIERPGPDWTWEDFLAIARATTVDEDGDGLPERYGVSLTQWLQAVAPWIWQQGGTLVDADGRHARMDERPFRDAMRFLQRLLHEDRVASFDASLAAQLTQGLFQAGRAALYGPVGYWETYRFRHIRDFAWDVLPLPRGREAATSVAMTVYVVPRAAREPELAVEFLRLLSGPRYQAMLAEIGNGVPGLVAAARSPSFLKPDVAPESEQVFLDALEHARFLPPLVNWYQVESLTGAELQAILLVPGTDVDAACERMDAKTQAYLERERRRAGRTPLPHGAMELALGLSFLVLAGTFLLRRGPRPPPDGRVRERQAYGMIALWASGFLLLVVGPGIVSMVLSLTEWSPLRPLADARWIGTENYARLAADATFHTSLKATGLYALLSVPLSLALALALALLLRATGTLAAVVRTVCYLPAVIAPIIVATLWRSVLDADGGLVNEALGAIGIRGPAWLRDPDWVVPSFVVMALWGVGAQMLVFLAALQALDRSLEEAARIDGAGRWSRFVHVTLPQLTPVVLFNLVTGSIAALQIFAQPYVTTEGGPGDASRFLVLYLYESGFRHLDMGYASAIAWVLFALSALLCLGLIGTSRRWVHYGGRRER